MCLASILDITLSKRFAPIKLAAEIAEMCGVVVLAMRQRGGHHQLLIDGRGWVRTTDLLNESRVAI